MRWTVEYGAGTNDLVDYPEWSKTFTLYTYQQNVPRAYLSPQAACTAACQASAQFGCASAAWTGAPGPAGSTLCEGTNTNGQHYGNFTIFAYNQTDSGRAFTCGNAQMVPYFASGGAPPGYTGGTVVRNSQAVMSLQALTAATWRNTKLTLDVIRQNWASTNFWWQP